MTVPTRGHMIRRCGGCGEPWLEPADLEVRHRSKCPRCRTDSHGMVLELEQLYAEHVAACAELRRLRARNRELEHTVDELRMRLIRLGDWRPL